MRQSGFISRLLETSDKTAHTVNAALHESHHVLRESARLVREDVLDLAQLCRARTRVCGCGLLKAKPSGHDCGYVSMRAFLSLPLSDRALREPRKRCKRLNSVEKNFQDLM